MSTSGQIIIVVVLIHHVLSVIHVFAYRLA